MFREGEDFSIGFFDMVRQARRQVSDCITVSELKAWRGQVPVKGVFYRFPSSGER